MTRNEWIEGPREGKEGKEGEKRGKRGRREGEKRRKKGEEGEEGRRDGNYEEKGAFERRATKESDWSRGEKS